MPAYAIVVVLDADDAGRAHAQLARRLDPMDTPQVQFVGEPWPVEPANRDALAAGDLLDATGDERLRTVADASPDFDTLDCFRQHPDAGVATSTLVVTHEGSGDGADAFASALALEVAKFDGVTSVRVA